MERTCTISQQPQKIEPNIDMSDGQLWLPANLGGRQILRYFTDNTSLYFLQSLGVATEGLPENWSSSDVISDKL
jgi:hypothetical protein